MSEELFDPDDYILPVLDWAETISIEYPHLRLLMATVSGFDDDLGAPHLMLPYPCGPYYGLLIWFSQDNRLNVSQSEWIKAATAANENYPFSYIMAFDNSETAIDAIKSYLSQDAKHPLTFH